MLEHQALDTKHMVASDLAASAASTPLGGASSEVLALATSPTDPIFASSTAVPGESTLLGLT